MSVHLDVACDVYDSVFCAVFFFQRNFFDEIWDLTESVSEGFLPTLVRYKNIGYYIDVLRQTACLVVNPIKVKDFAYLFD